MRRSRRGLLTWLLVLSIILSAGAVTALAAEEAYEPIDFDEAVSLSIAQYAEGHEFAADFPQANVEVDLYLVAEAVIQPGFDAIDLNLTDDFENVVDLTAMGTVAEQAAQAVAAMHTATAVNEDGEALVEPAYTIAYGGSKSSSDETDPLVRGLYLLVPHGADIEDYVAGDVTIARSPVYEYTFEPQLITVPTRVAGDGSSVVMTSDDGAWVYNITVTLKAERAERFGSLMIEKTVDGFDGKPATFVFSLTEVDETGAAVPGGYSNVASVYFNGGTSERTVVTMIPAGIRVAVEEIYSGARYDDVTEEPLQTVLIIADGAVSDETPMASVSYVNRYNNSGRGGYGIENLFTYEEGEWHLVTTPERDVNAQ